MGSSQSTSEYSWFPSKERGLKAGEIESTLSHTPVPVTVVYSYIGTNYHGLQLNKGVRTIDEDMFQAVSASGLLPPSAKFNLLRHGWINASKTDTGVHACAQILSFNTFARNLCSMDELPRILNSNLPEDAQIRVCGAANLGKYFNPYRYAEFRNYGYLLPVSAFAAETKGHLRFLRKDVCSVFVGRKNFHNYTKKVHPDDPSAMREVTEFTFSEPFVIDGERFVLFKIRGASFLLNQIRKMVASVICVSHEQLTLDSLQDTFSGDKWCLHRAPGDGLFLDSVDYSAFDRAANDATKSDAFFSSCRPQIEEWKTKALYPHIAKHVKEHNIYSKWIEGVIKIRAPSRE